MSIVSDQVRRLDAYLDRIPILSEGSSEAGSSEAEEHGQILHGQQALVAADAFAEPRLDKLLGIVQSLSTTNSSKPQLTAESIKHLLHRSEIPQLSLAVMDEEPTPKTPYETEIEWLLVSKAAVQLHGVILNTLLEQIIPLSDDIWYWDDVLSSYAYSSLYTVQTSPWRFRAWSIDIYNESWSRFRSTSVPDSSEAVAQANHNSLAQQWRQFYRIVRDSIRDRSFSNIQRKILSPVAFCRAEAIRKQAQLRKLREMTACGLGVLMSEGLQLVHDEDKANMLDHSGLKGTVERSVALMDMVLKEVLHIDLSIGDFEEKVFAGVEADPELSVHVEDVRATMRPGVLGRRLLYIIDKILPENISTMQGLVRDNGRPSPIVRYWLPSVIGILSSTTILQILVHRKADIINWIGDFGVTVRDFWFNWVIEPTSRVIQTIRHDKTSEIAILSRDSLRADRESLERMVVEFAVDHPHFADAAGASLSDSQITAIRTKVAEGDVTPVLKAYEKELRSPFKGAVRGDLIRSLLIQVQKTKVDLEVAMTGIDSLLKSQELVFGFVGLTPGVMVSIGMLQYLRSIFGGRSGQRQTRKSVQAVRILRNVDRILSEARPVENSNVLTYRDHGLLLSEVHILRNIVSKLMPRNIEREFQEDLADLVKMKGIHIQVKALARIRWAYARWLQ